jgi:hypothetical protein
VRADAGTRGVAFLAFCRSIDAITDQFALSRFLMTGPFLAGRHVEECTIPIKSEEAEMIHSVTWTTNI